MNRKHVLAVVSAPALTVMSGLRQGSAAARTQGRGARGDHGQNRLGLAADRSAGAYRHRHQERRATRDRRRSTRQGVEIGGKKVKFELVAEDDEANPTKATTVAQKLVDAKVAAVVGHFNSGASIPASKIYSDAGIPQISPSSTNPKYTQQGFKTTFRVVANDDQQGPTLAPLRARKAESEERRGDRRQHGLWPGPGRHFRGHRESRRAPRSSRASTPPTRTPTSRRS